MKPLFLLFTFLAVVPQVFSQNTKQGQKQECCITVITSDAGDTLHFSYDNSGRVQSITEASGYVTRFDYYSNIIVATETKNDSIAYKRVITIGSNDMMSNLFEESYNAGVPQWSYTSYTYNGKELKGTATVTSSRSVPVQTSLAWSNGNFISEKENGASTGVQFEYYPDKPVQPGDYWHINLLAALGTGDKLYRNKNLLKSIRSEKTTTEISYQFDENGKIVSMTKTTGSDRKIWKYEYS